MMIPVEPYFSPPGPVLVHEGALGPRSPVEIPKGAVVVGDGGDAAEDIHGSAPIQQRAVKALTLGIVAAAGAIDEGENAFHRAKGGVVGSDRDINQPRSQLGAFHRRGEAGGGVGAEVKYGPREAEARRQRESIGSGTGVDTNDLVVNHRVVSASVDHVQPGIQRIERDHGSVVTVTTGVGDPHQRGIRIVAPRTWFGDRRRKERGCRASHYTPHRGEIHRAGFEYQHSALLQRSQADAAAHGGEVQPGREIDAERSGIALIRSVSEDVPDGPPVPHAALVEGHGDGSCGGIENARRDQLQRACESGVHR